MSTYEKAAYLLAKLYLMRKTDFLSIEVEDIMEKAKERFGFFLDAFRYGTPPHGGVGIGLERLVMVLAGTDNIRDVVAFPTTNSALDLISESPNVVDQAQLDILGIEIANKDKE